MMEKTLREWCTLIEGTHTYGDKDEACKALGVPPCNPSVPMRRIRAALDAERAVVLEEVREWLDAYDDQVTQEAEAEAERWRHHGEYMRSVSDGVSRTLNAFETRFLAGKEGQG